MSYRDQAFDDVIRSCFRETPSDEALAVLRKEWAGWCADSAAPNSVKCAVEQRERVLELQAENDRLLKLIHTPRIVLAELQKAEGGMERRQSPTFEEQKHEALTFEEVFRVNLERCARWHPGGLEEWTALEWAGAMAGEAGEAANAAKKLKRLETCVKSINEPDRAFGNVLEARRKVALEVADTILYGLLLLARIGVEDPDEIIRGVFNRKSEEYGFPERL
ncbi:MAG TPA: hypothetical protein VHB45_13025 [Alloacidobacterium sp.]|nr:hypothetical protein [Alloacidobacterium sp.]